MPVDALALRYDRAAPKWDGKIGRLGYHNAYDHLIESARLPRDQPRVLDAGCGSGAFAAALHRSHKTVQIDLLDASSAMLSDARHRLQDVGAPGGVEYSALFSKVKSAAYSTVLAGHLVEHTNDPRRTILWLAERLIPGGTLVLAISKPHWCTALIRALWGHKAYEPETVVRWAEDAGLSGSSVAFPAGPPSRTSMGYVFRKVG